MSSRQIIKNVYIHLPFCQKKCLYCAFPVHAIGNQLAPDHQHQMYDTYLKHLLKEIDDTSIQTSTSLQSLYMGGGTPSLFPGHLLQKVINRFRISSHTEVTLEIMASDIAKLASYQHIGINRFSIGVQSLNNKLLERVNRPIYSSVQLEQTLKSSENSQLNYNIDLMLGMGESTKDRNNMLQLIERLRPPQTTIYMLEINEGSYLHKHNYQPGKQLTSNEEVADAYRNTCEFMDQLGYLHYEISSFYRKDLPLPKHNLTYWEGNRDFAAFGMGATSLIGGMRQTRPLTVSSYYRYIKGKESLTIQDQNIRKQALTVRLMSRMRTIKGITYNQLEDEFGSEIRQIIKQTIDDLMSLNPLLFTISDTNHKIELNPINGFLACDQIIYKILDSCEHLL